MAIAKYKIKDCNEALKQFEIFFNQSKEFCKIFLDDDKFLSLEKDNVFNTNKDIPQCLVDSEKIFSTIYGENHPFVKDYIAKIETF